MSLKIRRREFREPRIAYLRDFILNYHVADTDSISLNEKMFDELAIDFRNTYSEPIPQPFIFLGVWIKIVGAGIARETKAIITKYDPAPLPHESLIKNSTGKIYQCGYCKILIDEFGFALTGEAYQLAKERTGFTPAVCKSCERPAYN